MDAQQFGQWLDRMYDEKIADLQAALLASQERENGLVEALRMIASFGQTAMMGYHNAESIEVARAALGEKP